MRTIKFRVWDADFGKMVYEPTKDGYSVDMQSGILEVGLCDGDGDYFALPLMQFTGLLDKQGKEIYEGDIIKHPVCEVGKVVYFYSYAGFYVEARGLLYDLKTNGDYEVIGNQFENPELLS